MESRPERDNRERAYVHRPTINFRSSKSTLINSGATRNFIADQEARRLGLTIEKDPRKMKAINSEALTIVGVSKRVPFEIRGLVRRNRPCRGLYGRL